MLRNYLLSAFRNLTGNKLQTTINFVGLTTGLICFITIFLWMKDEFSFDKSFENKDRLYQLTITHPSGIKDSNVPFILPIMMAEEFPEISDFTRIIRLSHYQNCNFESETDGRYKNFLEQNVYLVDSGFFSVFTLPILSGNLEKSLSNNSSVYISQEIALKYFGKEDPIGKLLTLNKTDGFTVKAVFEAPEKSHLNFSILLPASDDYNNWNWSDPSYILLKEKVSEEAFSNKIADFFNEHHPYDLKGNFILGVLPISESYLGFGRMMFIYISSVIGFLILFIAGINYVNLSLANFTKRTKEMMVRNIVGASRFQLISHIIFESLIVCTISLLLAFVCVELLLPYFNKVFGRALEIEYNESMWMIGIIILLTVFYAFLVGIYPAIFLSNKRLFNKFQSIFQISKLRIYAVIFQFSISILLIICSVVVIKQLEFIRKKPLGIQTENIIKLPINRDLIQRYEPYTAALKNNENVLDVAYGQSLPFNEDYKSSNLEWPGKLPDDNPLFRYSITTSAYAEIFGMKILDGRYFNEGSTADFNNFIINETAAKQMGLKNPVGEKIKFHGHEGQIIGVVEDFHHVSLHREILPHIITISPQNYRALRHVFIKVKASNLPGTIEEIERVTENFSPDVPFQYGFVDKEIEILYSKEESLAQIITLFACLALFISSIGILGMTAFIIEHRTKEISIRKINGASIMDIIYLLNKKILKWVIIATISSGPIAYLISFFWLNNFAYKTSLSWWIFIISGGVTTLIALLSSCYETLIAAIKNPVETLRYE
jgi:putative ABC transport system permease protein